MSMQDPISDMLTIIRNGQMRHHAAVKTQHSGLKENILKVLLDEGYIASFKTEDEGNNKKSLAIELKYYNSQPVIREINRVSRPSIRRYAGKDALPDFFGGMGISIVSTSKGVMTERQARKENVGGEVLVQVA